ncbi:MAG: sensor histidine kinase [Bacteroidota bacterium]
MLRPLPLILTLIVLSASAGYAQKSGDRDSIQFINKNFYKIYSSDFDHAKELAKWAAETSHKNNWPSEEAWSQLNWGVVTFLSSDYNNVLPRYFRAVKLFDSLKDLNGLAAINNELAVFYHKQKDFEKSEDALDAAEAAGRTASNLEQLGTTLNHRGNWLGAEGKYKEARPYYNEVLKIRKQVKDSVGLGYIYLDFAEMAINEGDLRTALKSIDSSTVVRRNIGDLQGATVNLVNKGETYFGAGMYREALPLFLQGLEEGKKIGYTDLVRHTNGFVAETYELLGDYKNAYKYQQAGYKLKDSLFNIERTKVIQDLQTKYETDKKNQTIALHTATIERNYFIIGGLIIAVVLLVSLFVMWRSKNLQEHRTILQEQKLRLREAQINAVIESQEQERKRFATDLHDGMGQLISALQLNISSLRSQANVAAASFEKRDQLFESSEQLLGEVHDEIRNIAFNLMPPVLVKEGLVPAVHELVRKINKAGDIKAELSVFDMNERLPNVAEVSLYRVVQELLSNIIKYSRASEVTISFTGYDHEMVLTIDDNGDGYDLKAFQESNEGNGWRNVHSRISLIKGSIEIDTQQGRKNSTVIITVPLNEGIVSTKPLQNTERQV